MPTKRMSVDELISKHKSEIRESDGALFKAAAKIPGSWNEEMRNASFVMSAEVRDRTGDIISIAGMDTAEFEKNPIALWSHSYALPIGSWSSLQKVLSGRPKRLEGLMTYAPEGTDETADRIARLTGAGIVKACSVGIMVDWNEVEIEYDEEKRQYTWMLNRSNLVECSPCAVPANQAALAKTVGEERKFAMETVEHILDTWGKTPAGLIVPREEAEAAWKTLNDDKGATIVVDNAAAGGAIVSVSNFSQKSDDGFLARLFKAVGLQKAEDKSGDADEPPTPEPPKLATAEEKAAAAARADAVTARVERLLN